MCGFVFGKFRGRKNKSAQHELGQRYYLQYISVVVVVAAVVGTAGLGDDFENTFLQTFLGIQRPLGSCGLRRSSCKFILILMFPGDVPTDHPHGDNGSTVVYTVYIRIRVYACIHRRPEIIVSLYSGKCSQFMHAVWRLHA